MTDLKPGSQWLLPVTKLMGLTLGGSDRFITDRGLGISLLSRELDTLIPADRITELEAEVERQREALARWMLQNSYATGHGDTIDDLLAELDEQHTKRVRCI